MKKLITTLSLLTTLTMSSTAVLAGDYRYRDNGRTEKARVTEVQPIYRDVTVTTPQRECWNQPSRHRDDYQSYTSTIAGGIIGGVIGSQFGGGNGKTALAVAGTLLGGSLGRDFEARGRTYHTEYQQPCQVVEGQHREQHIEAYEVDYRYHGKHYTTVMDHHPGKFIPVDVHIEPRHRRFY